MTSYQSSGDLEFKQQDVRLDKDDRKYQAAQARAAGPSIQWGEKAQLSAPLPPPVTAHQQAINRALEPGAHPIPPHHERHDAIDLSAKAQEPAISVPYMPLTDSGVVNETTPLLRKQTSSSGGLSDTSSPHINPMPHLNTHQGDPIPAAIDVPEAVGEATGAALDCVVAKCKESIVKARSLHSLWKDAEKQAIEGGGDKTKVWKEGQSGEPTSTASTASSTSKLWNEGHSGTDMSLPAKSAGFKQQAQEKLAEAKEMFDSSVKPTLMHLGEQAKSVYENKVLPEIQKVGAAYSKATEKSSEEAAPVSEDGEVHEEGWRETAHQLEAKLESAYKRKLAPTIEKAKTSIASAYEEKVSVQQREQIRSTKQRVMTQMRGAWDKAADVWAGEEPIVREYVDRGVRLTKQYKMEIPLLFLATLLVLWASMSFVSWMAIPTRVVTTTLPSEYVPHWEPSTGPIQGPQLPSLTDKIWMKIDGADDKIRDSIGSMKHGVADRVTDRLHHVKDAMPTMDSLSELKDGIADRVQDRLHHVTDGLSELKEGVADRVSDRLHHVKDAMPAMPSMPSMHAHTAGPANLDVMDPDSHVVETMEHGHIEEHIELPGQSIPAATASGSLHSLGEKLGGIKDGVADRVQDRLHHVKDAMPSMDGIKQQAASIKASVVHTLSPQQHAAAGTANLDVMDPDSHVVETMEHGHVEEHIQI